MTTVGPDAGATCDGVLPHGISGGCYGDGDVWTSPVARARIMAMVVVWRGSGGGVVARGGSGNHMDVAAVEGAVAIAHGGHGLSGWVVGGRPSPGGVVAIAVAHDGNWKEGCS